MSGVNAETAADSQRQWHVTGCAVTHTDERERDDRDRCAASTGRAARVGATNAHADQRIDSHTKATITHHHRTRYGPSSPTIHDPR